MDDSILVDSPITWQKIKEVSEAGFGDMVKAVVDVEKRVMAIGASMHADEEAFLLDRGSDQKNLWGINIYPDLPASDRIEFDSMINIRPHQNNRSREVEDEALRTRIVAVVNELVT